MALTERFRREAQKNQRYNTNDHDHLLHLSTSLFAIQPKRILCQRTLLGQTNHSLYMSPPQPVRNAIQLQQRTVFYSPPTSVVTIISGSIITTVPVARIVPRSVIRVPIPTIGRRGVSICRRRVGIGSRWSIIPIGWGDGGAKETYPYKRCCYPYSPPRAARVAWFREDQCHPNDKEARQ